MTDVEEITPVEEVQSPFLEGTKIQFAWDSTSLELIKRCPRLYQYKMIDGWQPKGDNIHLRFGQELHSAFQDYDISKASGVKHEDALHDVVRALLERIHDWEPQPRKPSEKLKSKSNLLRTVICYLDEYKDDPAETHILENGKAAVELSFRFELDWGPDSDENPIQPYLLCGHLDRVVNFGNHLYVMDYKTSSTTPTEYYFDQYDPHNQMSLYTLATKIVLDAPIKGVIINALQIAVGFSRTVRGITYRNDERLDEWTYDLEYWLAQSEVYAKANYWPQNDTACDKYGGCPFRQICNKAPSVRENFLRSDFEKAEIWNPLRPR